MSKPNFAVSLLVLFWSVLPLLAQIEDHQEIEGPFKTPQEVTETCLECHEDAAQEVMQTIHWTWGRKVKDMPGHQGIIELGKKNVFNNFCIDVESNWPRCTSCHAGYGWKDQNFDFDSEENVDCLVCHDRTGKYKKSPAGAGMPAKEVNLLEVAQNVGTPTRTNCGVCHFFGGGGENVKHGDLDTGLIQPDSTYDIHMGREDMTCQECHETEAHNIKGESMAIVTDPSNRVLCEDCHDPKPHESKKINQHTDKIACQTCHIPYFAKSRPTKIYWDWSAAGKDSTAPKDEYGMDTYNKKKGSFRWGKNVKPEYYWYNLKSERYVKGDKIDPAKTVAINKPLGSRQDKDAKLYPFKVMRGKQIYDVKNKYLIVPKLWGGYWKHFDWNKAAEEGMKIAGLPYSGEYGFVKTEMFWKVNHMVSPKDEALGCKDCHGKGKNKRMDWKKLGYRGDQMYKKYRD